VPGQQRRHQRQQGVQVRRQIDIHVREHLGVALRPDGPQRPAAARQVHVDGPHLGVAGQPVAMAQVPSVLPLSAIVTRAVNGKLSRR
jgi:hypothetical protein